MDAEEIIPAIGKCRLYIIHITVDPRIEEINIVEFGKHPLGSQFYEVVAIGKKLSE